MKVWVLLIGKYDPCVLAVFSTEEKADTYMTKLREGSPWLVLSSQPRELNPTLEDKR